MPRLELADPPDTRDSKLLYDSVRSFNQAKTGNERPRTVAYFYKDDDGKIVGGVQGMLWGRSMHIDVLWVDENQRGLRLGSNLMLAIEQYAIDHHHPLIYVETTSFQALPFYQSLGYEKFGELPGISEGHTLYFLKKELAP